MAEFKEEPRGVVVSMDLNEFSGAIYSVWFPYTRSYINEILEGSLVAIRNFRSQEGRRAYSILELVSVLPTHYALGSSSSATERAFPGFVIEAAKSAKVDWEQEEPIEQTTKIKAVAIPTNLQLESRDGEINLIPDESMPMIGEEVFLLTDELTNKIVNRGLLSDQVATISPGHLVLNPEVDVHISVEDMLRTHFGVFGFTGAGKSNLTSTVISHLLSAEKTVKISLFDLMAEYTGLLIDVLDKLDDAYIVVFGEDALPGGDSTRDYLYGDTGKLDDAADAIARTLLLPKDLLKERRHYKRYIRRILENRKIRIYDPGVETLRIDHVLEELNTCIKGRLGNAENPLNEWVDSRLSGEGHQPVSSELIDIMIKELQDFLKRGIPETFSAISSGGTVQAELFQEGSAQTIRPDTRRVDLNNTARSVVNAMIRKLHNFEEEPEEKPADATLSRYEIRDILNSKSNPSLIIFQSNSDDELRVRSSEIVNTVFNFRRRLGAIEPLALFIYDEADEFIPQTFSRDSSYGWSVGSITTLARRGRKFGIGMAIATQRVAHLNTSILAQPHTYFISKLPREYDRDAIAKAFGVTDDMMRKSLKFTKGEWLLVSYDATGLVNVPLPVKLENANERILHYLNSGEEGKD